MKRLNETVTIPALCLVVFLFIADNQVAGQGNLTTQTGCPARINSHCASGSTSFSK